jgi:hypothetical protein
MNYFDIDRPRLDYLPYCTQTTETCSAAGLQKSRSSGFHGNTEPRPKTSKIYGRHEISGISRHRWKAEGTDVSGSKLALIYSATL